MKDGGAENDRHEIPGHQIAELKLPDMKQQDMKVQNFKLRDDYCFCIRSISRLFRLYIASCLPYLFHSTQTQFSLSSEL